MIRKRVVENSTEPDDVRRLRDDLYGDIGQGTRILLGRVIEIQNDGTIIFSVDGARYEAQNFAISELELGDSVAAILDTDKTVYIIGVRR